jgi:hypothetical protein
MERDGARRRLAESLGWRNGGLPDQNIQYTKLLQWRNVFFQIVKPRLPGITIKVAGCGIESPGVRETFVSRARLKSTEPCPTLKRRRETVCALFQSRVFQSRVTEASSVESRLSCRACFRDWPAYWIC